MNKNFKFSKFTKFAKNHLNTNKNNNNFINTSKKKLTHSKTFEKPYKKNVKNYTNLQTAPNDPFLFTQRNYTTFPTYQINSLFESNFISINLALQNYLDDLSSGDKPKPTAKANAKATPQQPQSKKLFEMTEEKENIKLNMIDIYKFSLDRIFIESMKNTLNRFNTSSNKTMRIFFDGGCALANRTGFFGCSFYIENQNIIRIAGNIGPENTNNVAEYTGLIMSLAILNTILPYFNSQNYSLIFYSDSEFLCKQMQGKYKVKTPHIIILHSIAQKLYKNIRIEKKDIVHIRREYNEEADYIGNIARRYEYNTFKVFY
jgi:ribonuclease HI